MPVANPNTQRIIYATQAVGLGTGITAPHTTAPTSVANSGAGFFEWLHGVQTLSVSTTFNTEQLFELGQLQVYQHVDEIPDIELSLEKVLDGHRLLYLCAVGQAGTGNVLEAAKGSCDAVILVYPDTNTSASGTGTNGIMHLPTLRVSNVSYTFGTDGNFTESLTLVGNDKIWYKPATNVDYVTPYKLISENPDTPAAGDTGQILPVAKRNSIRFNSTNTNTEFTILPSSVYNVVRNGTGNLQSATISADFGREDNFELGRYRPYTKFVTVPLQATCDFEVLALSGDYVSASGDGPRVGSSHNERIQVVLDMDTATPGNSGYLKIDLGTQCRLTAVNYGGGDSGGGNVTNTYNYASFNYFKVTDTHAATGGYWS